MTFEEMRVRLANRDAIREKIPPDPEIPVPEIPNTKAAALRWETPQIKPKSQMGPHLPRVGVRRTFVKV